VPLLRAGGREEESQVGLVLVLTFCINSTMAYY